jgi:hypothetical protein
VLVMGSLAVAKGGQNRQSAMDQAQWRWISNIYCSHVF